MKEPLGKNGTKSGGVQRASDKATRKGQSEETEGSFGSWMVLQRARNRYRGRKQSRETAKREDDQREFGSRLGQKGKATEQGMQSAGTYTFMAGVGETGEERSATKGLDREWRIRKEKSPWPTGPLASSGQYREKRGARGLQGKEGLDQGKVKGAQEG